MLLFLVAVWKEKKSVVNTTKGIKNIPRKIPQSVWQNVREGQCVAVHFEKGVAPILNRKNAFPTVARNCIFARRFRLLGDFYRVGAEIFQIVKKSSVFGHSFAKQVPQ